MVSTEEVRRRIEAGVAGARVEVVDTTGCGDVFHGAFAFGLARGWDVARNARFASATAALKCRALGGRTGIPTYGEVVAFLQAHP